jgi:hypothetical protein
MSQVFSCGTGPEISFYHTIGLAGLQLQALNNFTGDTGDWGHFIRACGELKSRSADYAKRRNNTPPPRRFSDTAWDPLLQDRVGHAIHAYAVRDPGQAYFRSEVLAFSPQMSAPLHFPGHELRRDSIAELRLENVRQNPELRLSGLLVGPRVASTIR